MYGPYSVFLLLCLLYVIVLDLQSLHEGPNLLFLRRSGAEFPSILKNI